MYKKTGIFGVGFFDFAGEMLIWERLSDIFNIIALIQFIVVRYLRDDVCKFRRRFLC